MGFKSKLKNIPIFSSFIRNIKWRIYRPIFITVWSLKRTMVYSLKSKGFIKWNTNEQSLKKLKQSHSGETAFIIGNGPSLRASDLDLLHKKGVYCFAANRINLIFNQTEWRPNCYLALDRQIYRDNDPTIPEMIKANIELYIFGKEAYQGIPSSLKADNILSFERKTNSYYQKVHEFSEDALKYVVDGFTVTYAALQLAYYMGFETVYLLGVDCNYNRLINRNGHIKEVGQNATYFTSKYDPKSSNSGYIDGMLEAYETAQSFSQGRKFNILNTTRGGKLEVFKRVDFDKLLNHSFNCNL